MEWVSVIMPTYNSRNTLKQALDSIVAQTYRPIQIISIDDASSDDSFAFAKAYASKQKSSELEFINLHNTTNLGAGVTRNKGIEAATGSYIAFLDADDVWKPYKLEVQVSAMRDSGATLCYGAYEIFTQKPETPEAIQWVHQKLSFQQLKKANYIGQLTGIYNAEQLGKFYMPPLRKRQDWAMWLDVIQKADFALGIQEPVAGYRLGTGLSSNKWDLVKYNYAVYRQHLGYSAPKSFGMMLLFFYEQFFVKASMKKKL